jgi:glyoxalase family protein
MQTQLDGIHHVTGMTADVQRNVDFWVGILGLRLVSKTLNFETTSRYHLYYGDETGRPGSVVTFGEVVRLDGPATSALAWAAPVAQPGEGNIVSAVLRVRSFDAIEFWLKRLAAHGVYSEMFRIDPAAPERLVFHDFEGHCVELIVDRDSEVQLVAEADDIPPEFRITGIDGVRSAARLDAVLPEAAHLGFTQAGDLLELRGPTRTARWRFEDPATVAGRPFQPLAIGVWHHMALDAGDALVAARDEADAGPLPWTGVFDHYMFDSAYAPTPGGFLELCSYAPGFLVNHAGNEDLGEVLALSPWTEPLRERLEHDLAPIVNPRPRVKDASAAAPGKASGRRPRPRKADPVAA